MAKSADLWRQLELYETTTQVAQSVD
jgi:hypothetical protein